MWLVHGRFAKNIPKIKINYELRNDPQLWKTTYRRCGLTTADKWTSRENNNAFMADNSNLIENENDILITNYSHGQVKPRLTEKRETLKGESWLPYHMEEKREKLLARIYEWNFVKNVKIPKCVKRVQWFGDRTYKMRWFQWREQNRYLMINE